MTEKLEPFAFVFSRHIQCKRFSRKCLLKLNSRRSIHAVFMQSDTLQAPVAYPEGKTMGPPANLTQIFLSVSKTFENDLVDSILV